MSASNPLPGRKRLDSWKEIAVFFGRDERTANRWEKELGLPIHRLPGTKGRVYAYTDELAAWLAAPQNAGALLTRYNSAGQPGPGSPGLTVVAGRRTPVEAAPLASPSGEQIRAPSAVRYRNTIRLVAAAVVGVGIAAVVLLSYPSPSRSPKTAGHAASLPRPPSSAIVAQASTPSHNPEAEQLYLKGRYYWNKRTPDDLNKALDYFVQAMVHDPSYAPAYVGMADCYDLLREYTRMPAREAYPRALAAAQKAVELDGQSSEAHASLAFVSFFGMWDVATGEREFRRAIDLNPNNSVAHHWYANGLLALHRLPEALEEIDRAQALDPASSAILADKGNILLVAGRTEEALSLLTQMENREPAFRSPHLYLKILYLRSRDYPNFLSELRKDALWSTTIRHSPSQTQPGKASRPVEPRACWKPCCRSSKNSTFSTRFHPPTLPRPMPCWGIKAKPCVT